MPFFVSVAYATNRSSSDTANSVASAAVTRLADARSRMVSGAPVSFVLSALGAGELDGDADGAGAALGPPALGPADAATAGGVGSPRGGALGRADATGDGEVAGDPLGAGDGSARYANVAPPFFATAKLLTSSTISAGLAASRSRMPSPFFGCCATGFFAFFAASTSFFAATCVNTTKRAPAANAGALPRGSRRSAPESRSRTTSAGSPSCGVSAYASLRPSSDSFGVSMRLQPSYAL